MAESAENSTMERNKILLQCAICLDDVKNHRALTCQHTFCQKCLEPLVEGHSIPCPVCREVCYMKGPDVSCLPRNLTLVAFMDEMCEKCKCKTKDLKCDHCEKQVCQQCYEQCKELIGAQNQETQAEIKAMLSKGRTSLKKIQDDTIRIHKEITTAIKQVDSIADMDREANHLRYQQLVDKLAATKVRHKQLVEELEANEVCQHEIQDELKTFESYPNQANEEINHKQKWLKQHIETEGNSEIKRLGELYDDINKTMDTMEAILDELRSNSCDDKASGVISKICKKWKSEAHEVKKLQTMTRGVYLSVDQGEDVNNETTRISKMSVIKRSIEPINYGNKGMAKYAISRKGSKCGQFTLPSHAAVSMATGNVVVCDKGNNRVQILSSKLQFLLSFGSYGSGDEQFDFGTQYSAGGVAVLPNEHIVVADTKNNRLQVYNEQGEYIRSIGPDIGRDAPISNPLGIASDTTGRIYVNDFGNKRILVLGEDATVYRVFGTKDVMGDWSPRGLAICADGDVVIADYEGKLQLFNRDGQHSHSIDGPGYVNLKKAWSVAVDTDKNIIVTVQGSKRIHVLTSSGKILHAFDIKGNTPADFHTLYVTVTKDGNIVVVDQCNHRLQIL